MRLIILLIILGITLSGSGFWYTYIDTTCRLPVAYRIGEIDARFGTTPEEVRRIAGHAEAIWEKSVGADLFVYNPNAKLPIHFIFDERQENAEREADLREDLAVKEGMSETVGAQYQALVTEFRTLKRQYESRVLAYESSLKRYNKKVEEWNSKGGAPQDEINLLTSEEQELENEYIALEKLSDSINKLVDELNKIGARGNSLVADYNTIVETYNDEFSEAKEFTQGDYTGDAIHIYQFDSEDELTVVLAHEFGHALSLDHVQNESSIMYHFMGVQSAYNGISDEDMQEFTAVCEKKNPFIEGLYGLKALW